MSEGEEEEPRVGPWVKGSFVFLGLLALAAISVSIIDAVRGPDTYEAATLFTVKEGSLDRVESMVNGPAFQVELAQAAGVPSLGTEVVACRPDTTSDLQVSVRSRDRAATGRLAAEVVPTLQSDLGGAEAESIRELTTTGVSVVDPDHAPRCDLSLESLLGH